MNKPRVAITCPIPADPTNVFLEALPRDVDLLISDDSNGKLSFTQDRQRTFSYDYEAQQKVIGKDYEMFKKFHKSASCRNFVHYMAYKEGYDYIVALDYDCVVPKNYIETHLRPLEAKSTVIRSSSTGWVNPIESEQWYTRGYPYSKRVPGAKVTERDSDARVVLNMGLWENVVDINGIDKVRGPAPKQFPKTRPYSGVDGFIPLCGMNNIFIREITPAYFFLPNFKVGDWEVSRHDDIWGGYIFQKLAQKKGDIITYGDPVVFHERESNQAGVLYYEHSMHALEPYFYDLVDSAAEHLKQSTYRDMFAAFADGFAVELSKRSQKLPSHYYAAFMDLHSALNLWTRLFQKLS